MPLETLSGSTRSLTSPSTYTVAFSSPVHQLHHRPRVGFSASAESRFCSSLKMLRRAPSTTVDNGGLFGVRCGGGGGVGGGGEGENGVDDAFYMRRCVEIARKALGHTSPNPMVGCVIVKDGKVVGEGFHPKAGQPHAEVFALRDAGELAENATAYVSLEPCNHHGRTPPCTEALMKARVKKVVVGMVDPNPIVASKGVGRLRNAGIAVEVGVEEELCKKLNEAYIHKMLTGKPFVTLRYTLSVNGNLLDNLGDRVTETGGYYSQLLQENDAVVISRSSSTEFSIPTSKESGANQPVRIITLNGPAAQIKINDISPEVADKVVIVTEGTVEPEVVQKGIKTLVLDRVNLNDILEYCKNLGLCSVLIDLRGSIANLEEILREGIEQKLLQKLVVELLPIWDEKDGGNSLAVFKSLQKRLEVKNLEPRISGPSTVLEGYL